MRPREQRSPAARSDHHGHYFLTRAEREGVRSGHGGTLERCWMEAKTAARVPPTRARTLSPPLTSPGRGGDTRRQVHKAPVDIRRSLRHSRGTRDGRGPDPCATRPAACASAGARPVPCTGSSASRCRSYCLPQPGPLPPSASPRQQLKLRDSEALFSPYALQVLARPHTSLWRAQARPMSLRTLLIALPRCADQ